MDLDWEVNYIIITFNSLWMVVLVKTYFDEIII